MPAAYTPVVPSTDDPTIFPALPGQGFPPAKSPMWSTGIAGATSGRERRRRLWSYPKWQFKLAYEVLRDMPSVSDLQRLYGFFNLHAGRFSAFSYYDPTDNLVTNQQFGVGDGVTTTFQLTRTGGAGSMTFVEPVKAVLGGPQVSVGNASLSGTPSKNCLQSSDDYTAAGWGKGNCAVYPGIGPDPIGGSNASRIARTASGNDYLYQPLAQSFASQTVTFSAYLKWSGTTGGPIALRIKDLLGNELGSVVVNDIGNWQRASVTALVPTGAAAGLSVAVDPTNDAGSAGDDFFLWGAQLEIGASATGYIHTPATDFIISSLGQITFATAPTAGTPLTWSGQFMFRVRFDQDQLDAEQMMTALWSLSGLTLVSDRP